MAKKAIEYKSIKDVPTKYKWNLEPLLEGKTPEQAIKDAIDLARRTLVPIKDSKYKSPEAYLEYIKLEENFYAQISKVMTYLRNGSNIDVTNVKLRQLLELMHIEIEKLNIEIGAELPRIKEHQAEIRKWRDLPSFKEVRFLIDSLLRELPHSLPKDIEEYELSIMRGRADFEQIFSILTDVEVDKGSAVSSSGVKTKITNANFSTLVKSDDENVRKSAYISFAKGYLNVKETLASLLYQHKRAESVKAKTRHYASTVDMNLFGDYTDQSILPPLYKAAAENVKHGRRYLWNYDRFYKIVYGEKPTKYDRARLLVKFEKDVPVEQGIKEVLSALSPFGDKYMSAVKKAINENWIDFFVVKNKSSGAYSSGRRIPQKLILMNWENTPRSTETLAHELGHSMQSYFIDQKNRPALTDYSLFLAEVASIFNELMLQDYWLKTSKDDKEKFDILSRFIDGFAATVFRQVLFANYEYDLYNKIDQGVPVNNYESMSHIFYENYLKYTLVESEVNKKFKSDDFFYAVRVPHYYYGFYVHRYAIGQLVACIFFQMYRENGPKALQDYLNNFVSIGTIDTPINILKKAGIDLHNPKTYNIGFKFYSDLVAEHEKLGNKIFKEKASPKAKVASKSKTAAKPKAKSVSKSKIAAKPAQKKRTASKKATTKKAR